LVLPLGARGGKAFAAVREHLRSRYGFDFTAVLPPPRNSITWPGWFITRARARRCSRSTAC